MTEKQQLTNKTTMSTGGIQLHCTLKLSEIEVRALIKIAQYGADPYIRWFKEHLSRYELEGLEPGIKSLFNTVRKELPQHVSKVDKAREVLKS